MKRLGLVLVCLLGCCAARADNSVVVSWIAPTQNVDGSSYSNPKGFKIYWGKDPGALTTMVDVPGVQATQATVKGLGGGTFYFAIAAIDAENLSSDLSSIASVTLAEPPKLVEVPG